MPNGRLTPTERGADKALIGFQSHLFVYQNVFYQFEVFHWKSGSLGSESVLNRQKPELTDCVKTS